MDDNGTRPAGNIGEEVEDCVEDRAELDSLVLDDTESVAGGSEYWCCVSGALEE